MKNKKWISLLLAGMMAVGTMSGTGSASVLRSITKAVLYIMHCRILFIMD